MAHAEHTQDEPSTQITSTAPRYTDGALTPANDETKGSARSITPQPSLVKEEDPHPAWKTWVIRAGPLSGLACMLLALISILVSLAVLLSSDGAPAGSWSLQPSAILAVCTAVANQSVRFAAFQGSIIAWWSSALRGSTLKGLHDTYRAGTTVFGAIRAGKRMGILGMACLASTLIALDGPFLQKATTVRVAQLDEVVHLSVSLAPELPRSYSGGWNTIETNSSYRDGIYFGRTFPTANGLAPNTVASGIRMLFLATAVQPYSRNTPMAEAVHGCPKGRKCKTKVRAPALANTACTSHVIPVNYHQPSNNSWLSAWTLHPALDRLDFVIDIMLLLGSESESINVVTGYAQMTDCVGTFNYTACTLRSAVGEYDVSVQDGVVALAGDGMPDIVALANNTPVITAWDADQLGHPSTLSGIVTSAGDSWKSLEALFKLDGEVQAFGSNTKLLNYVDFTNGAAICQYSYRDPLPDLLRDLNKRMFYSGWATAQKYDSTWFQTRLDPGLEVNTTTTGHLVGEQNVFHTDLRWFMAAALVEGICLALILPTYFGCWRIGRAVSFSPVETARAFEAPLLSDCNSNSSGRDITKVAGAVRVRYGTVAVNSATGPGQTKLTFADPSLVRSPARHHRFEI